MFKFRWIPRGFRWRNFILKVWHQISFGIWLMPHSVRGDLSSCCVRLLHQSYQIIYNTQNGDLVCAVASAHFGGNLSLFDWNFFLACNWGFWQKYTSNTDTKTGQHLLRSWVRRTLEISVAVASESFCNETRWEFWGQIALFSITEYYIKTSVCCSRHKIDLIRTLWMVEAQKSNWQISA